MKANQMSEHSEFMTEMIYENSMLEHIRLCILEVDWDIMIYTAKYVSQCITIYNVFIM